MGRVQRGTSGLGAVALAILLTASLASGQSVPSASSTTPQTVVDVLHQLSDKADVIFAGQVVAIRRPDAGVVEVEFRVDQAILGCTVGTPYILREWAGLWERETQRYRVGQNLLMLLHAPSAAGMSSPVGGLDGAIPIRQGGAESPLANGAIPRQPPFVDLRWLGAKLPRSVSYRNEAAPGTKPGNSYAPIHSQLRTTSVAASGSVTNAAPITPIADNAGSSGSSVPAQQASVNAVIGMLTSWQKAQHGAP
jgi:hypothetical protein